MKRTALFFTDPDAPSPGYVSASLDFLTDRAKGISRIPRRDMIERGIDPEHWIAAACIVERRLLPLARAGYHVDRMESAFERCICRVYNARRLAALRASD